MHSLISVFTTYLPYFILVLTLLVFVHEFGHYWVGRRFGIHAEVFSIGFGAALFWWAAPTANLVFPVTLLTAVFFSAGEPYSPPTVAVQVDGPAAKAGLRTGDEIVRLGDKHIDRYEDIQESQFLYWAKPMAVEYRRGNQLLNA